MILYSTQDLSICESIMDGNTHRALRPFVTKDPEIDEWFDRSYSWMREKMIERIGPAPAQDVYPTWAFYQWWGSDKKKPDLRYRSARMFAERRTCALMTLEIPDDQVLLSDYDGFHFPLNSWYLGDETRGDEIHKFVCENKFHSFEDYPLILQQEIKDSWNQIFDLDCVPPLLEFDKKDQVIQATFWEIKPEYLKEAIRFDKTGKTERIL